jgi:hypothetical protein
MANITRPQASVAIPWARGSVIRGTLRAREMVANARMASRRAVSRFKKKDDLEELTHGSNNLSLETKLVLETTGKVGDTTLAVACNVRNLADVVEHVAAGEEEDSDQTDSGPEVATLEDGKDVGGCDGEGGDGSEDGYGGGDDFDVVDWTGNGGGRAGDMASEPGVNGLGCDDTGGLLARGWYKEEFEDLPSGEVEAEGLSVGLSVRTGGGGEVEQDGGSGELQRLESPLAIGEVEGSHDESGLLLLVSLGPRFAQQVPFGLELVTDGTSESGFESGQEDGDRVVAGRRGQFGVFIVVELEGSCGGQLLRSVVGELVG